MKIVSTFVDNLYAIQYPDEDVDELERLLDLWEDIEYLENFFENNKEDLVYFNEVTVEEAIRKTRKEVKEMRDLLLSNQFIIGFRPLDDLEYGTITLSKQKGKRIWLRLYAIKIDAYFLITGGAIKLTHKMQDRPHTNNELGKLTQCRDFLSENGVFDTDSLIDFLEF